jgi:hypothetical protein
MTEDQITAAARALSNDNADICNVNREDNWMLYGDSFRETAKIALEAAFAAAPAAPEGFALVPLEPPIDMVVAAERWLVNLQHMRASDKREAVTQALRAAIAAAPTELK